MLLKVDKKGNIIQSDSRFNGVSSFGQAPELVDAGDMFEISNLEDPKISKDKQALRNLEMLDKKNRIKRYSEDQKKKAAMKARKAAHLEKLYNQKKQQAYKAQLMQNMSYLNAQQKSGQGEIMSGVSGYGPSADGRQPDLSRASTDWQPINQANTAFGGDVEEFGQNTAFGYHSNTHVNKIKLDGLGYSQSAWSDVEEQTSKPYHAFQRKSFKPENEAAQAEILNEAMTTDDEYALRQFLDGGFDINVYRPDQPRRISHQVTDDAWKQQVNTRNNNWNHSSEMAKVISQGWGYSILDDGKNIKLVKVPYYWGLPMFVPDNNRNLYTALSTALGPYWGYPYAGPGHEFRNGSTSREGKRATYFQALYPVIKAAAKEFALYSDQYGVWQGRQFQNKLSSRNKQPSGGPGFFKKLFSSVDPNFNHPMIKQGLLK